MPYDQHLVERVRRYFKEQNASFREIKMMGGVCMMVDEKMCVGMLFNKKVNSHLMMARVGAEAYESCLKKEGAKPMDFTGRPMKGFIWITPDGYDLDKDLEFWLAKCLAHNPFAKRSKKKK